MEDFQDLPDTPESREAAKGGQLGAISRLKGLLDRFESSCYWGNCLEQLTEAVNSLKARTIALEMADLEDEEE